MMGSMNLKELWEKFWWVVVLAALVLAWVTGVLPLPV